MTGEQLPTLASLYGKFPTLTGGVDSVTHVRRIRDRQHRLAPLRPWEDGKEFSRSASRYESFRHFHRLHGYQGCPLHSMSGGCIPGFVYLARCEAFVKIGGTALGPEQRIDVLRKHMRREDLELVGVLKVKCWRAGEGAAHLLAYDRHVAGEWYFDGPVVQLVMGSNLDGQVIE